MMIWMSMSLITDLHWWGPWCLCLWSLTCIDEVPDDDLDVYVSDHWPALMRSLMMIWMSMSLITDLSLMRSLMMIWMSMSLITDLHWWGPWCLCLWSLTCIDEVPDVYVSDHWPALMRSLMMIWMSMSLITDLHWWGLWWWSDVYVSDHWPALMRSLMSMSLITDLHWWGPWWWSGCLCLWSLTCIDEVLMMIWCLCLWSLTCIDEVSDDDLDVYVSDHWPALMRSLMMICPWCLCLWSLTCIDEVPDDDLDVYVSDHWPALMRSLMMICMSMSLITDLHWWGPWWWSVCLCLWSLTCIDEVPDVYVSDHWPALMRFLMMIWMSMSLITDLHWWGPWWWSGCLWSLTCIDEVPDDDLDVYVSDHRPALMRSLMMIYVSDHWPAFMRSLMMIWMSLITDLHWWGPWWWSGCLCLWSLTCIDEVPDVYVSDHWPALMMSLMMIWMSVSLITGIQIIIRDLINAGQWSET